MRRPANRYARTLDGITDLGETTWPISTVFRLYLENLNWVSNAETAGGPTQRTSPQYEEFLAGVSALQRLTDRQGYWFCVDKRDCDSMATFNLMVKLSRLELGAKAGTAQILTLPLGGP